MKCSKCAKEAKCRGMCLNHYSYARKSGEISAKYKKEKQKGKICNVEGCNKECFTKGICRHHYNRIYHYGSYIKEIDKSNWTKENIAWVAGIIEGEGYFSLKKPDKKNGRIYLRIGINMTDFDVLFKIKNIIGYGNLEGPYIDKK